MSTVEAAAVAVAVVDAGVECVAFACRLFVCTNRIYGYSNIRRGICSNDLYIPRTCS